MSEKKTRAEIITDKFFKLRFPNKSIEIEKETGYYWTWVRRFENPNPTPYMDNQSLECWKQINGL